MFTALRHNLVNSGTTLVTEFCNILSLNNLFGAIANCSIPYAAANGASFSGTSRLARGSAWTGAADGKEFLFSFWVNMAADGSNMSYSEPSSGRVDLFHNTNNTMLVRMRNTAGTNLLNVSTAGTIVAADGWVHVIGSGDAAVANSVYVYINDTVDANFNGISMTNQDIDLARTDATFGGYTTGGFLLQGCLQEFFWTNEYLDLSDVNNRRKFIDAAGKPVDLGSDGSTPTGTAPWCYLNNPFGSFQTNKGTGGNLTVTGSLSDCGSSPSD